MSIQWYPGHMHKAQKEIKETLPQIDLVIEVLDARIPFSSENPLLERLRGPKPCIKILSKSDLADPAVTAQWQEYLEQAKGVKTLALTSTEPGRTKLVSELCRKMLPGRDRSVNAIRTMIVGIPNVGKSTLINTLAGRTVAKTGNEPAVTKRQQKIRIDNDIVLNDTPGILWPKVEIENSGYRLATTGAIKDTAMDYDEVAFFAAEYLLNAYPELLRSRYQLETLPSKALDLLEAIGRQRGCLGSGGRVNLNQASEKFIGDYRSGKIGRITLETPAMVEREKAELAVLLEQKRLAKEARKAAKAPQRQRQAAERAAGKTKDE